MGQPVKDSAEETSPRSTVLTVDAAHQHMTPNLANRGMNDTSVSSNEGDIKSSPSGGGGNVVVVADSSSEDLKQGGSNSKSSSPEKRSSSSSHHAGDVPLSPTPQMITSSSANYSSSQGTPQQPNRATGAYGGYHHQYQHQQHQMTPEPPSPGGPVVLQPSSEAYNVGSFFQQQAGVAFVPSHTSPFGVSQPSPLSPPRPAAAVAMAAMGVIPPASPLFPRLSSGGGSNHNVRTALNPSDSSLSGVVTSRGGIAPPSPNIIYSTMYQTYGSNQVVSSHSIISPDDGSGGVSGSWNDRNSQQSHLMNSPQVNLNAQGIPVSYAVPGTRSNMGGRAYSFEDSMLPPSALDPQDQGNPAYSPYGGSQGSSGGGTLFAHPQPWGYGPPDIYGNTPGSPLQPRPTTHLPMYPSQMPAGNMRGPMAAYGQYFPASSPGPPIQTTASNKGPDGANLFIFHIPNHFTNLDMYQLFCPYGNLLSVRIMVEKDTGRSRGFGFVSYDSPESAALAIKELNGFAIGNKRLKVQHKQIRSKDFNDHDMFDGVMPDGYPRSHFNSSLPPSGPMAAAHSVWYDTRKTAPPGSVGVGADVKQQQDESTELTSTSTGGETTSLGLVGTSGGEATAGTNSLSPLASLGTLQNALPDVAGNGTQE